MFELKNNKMTTIDYRSNFRPSMIYFIVSAYIISSLIAETSSFQQPFLLVHSKIDGATHRSIDNVSSLGRVSLNNKCGVVSSNYRATQLQLSPSPALSSLLNPLGSVTVLALVVLIHESGHFLAARSMGIAVKEFSVGVGPRLAGFTRKVADGSEIDFSLRAIPLGGYVQFPENYNATLLYLDEKERFEKREQEREQDNISEEESAGWKQNIMSFMNKDRNAQRLEETRILKEKEENERRRKSGWWNSLSFQKNKDAEEKVNLPEKSIEIEYYDDPNLLQNRPWNERAIVLVGGVVFNILLAFTLYFGELTIGAGLPKPSFQSGALISQAPRSDSPSAGVLQKGDIILGINGRNMFSSDSPTAYETQDSISNFIKQIRAAEAGESLHLSVLRNGEKSSPVVIDVSPRQTLEGLMSIGITLSPNYQGRVLVQATSVGDGIVKAGKEVSSLTSDTARSIFSLLGSLVSGRGTPAGQSVSGPIGVLKSGADVVSTNDISAVIGFVAAISVNLAVVNSLPLPALDGGQLVFVLSEAVTGKKIDQRKQEAINATALLFLLALSFGTTVGDLGILSKLGR